MFWQKFPWRFAIITLGAWLFLVSSFTAFGLVAEKEKGLFYYVVDRSGSITAYGLTEPVRRAITEHAAQLPEDTEVRLVFFSRTASEPQRWESMTPEAEKDFAGAFKKGFVPDGPTRLYDTVGEVMEEVRAATEDYRFVSILVFSDGENNWSRSYRSWQELEPLYEGLLNRHEQSFIYWITLEFEPSEPPPPWVIHEPQPPGTIEIPIPEPAPLAEFTAYPRQLKVGEPIQFEYVVKGGRVTQFHWDFGDGSSATVQNPVHHYKKDGIYTVRLVTTGPGGEAEEVKEDFVQVAPVIPLTARFRFEAERPKVGDTLPLQDLSEGNPEKWEWTVNGEVLSTANGAFVTAEEAGEMTVALTVWRGEESDTAEQTIEILPLPPVADFSVQPEEAQFGEPILLTAQESKPDWKHRWVINGEVELEGNNVEWTSDRHGLLQVVHTVEGPGGFAREADRVFVHPPVEVIPDTSFSAEPTMFVQGDTIVFRAGKTAGNLRHQWLIDGEVLGEGPEWTWESDRPGNILVTHRVTELDTDAVFEESDEILGRKPELIQVAFSASETEGTFPLTVRFKDESVGEGVAYHWDFGDGNVSDQRNPVHTYEKAGEYAVSLEVTNRLGAVTGNIDPVLISVVPPMPVWQKAAIAGLIALIVWVGLIVPLILRPMLAPQRGPKLVGMRTYPIRMAAKQGWTRFFWPKSAVTIGSALDSDIRLASTGVKRENIALIERSPAGSSYSIRPIDGHEIYKIEKQTSLLNPDTEEKSKVGRGRVLKDGDAYEIAGERLKWCQPRKRPGRPATGKQRSNATSRRASKPSIARAGRKQPLARVKN